MDLNNYAEVDFHTIENVMTIVLANKSILNDITGVEHEGLDSGSTGKGTVIIKMKVFDTKLCFINAHLIKGQSKFLDRLNQIQEIHAKGF